MTADPVLVVAWLVLAHLAADFVFQTGSIALAKSRRGSRALGGLLVHGLIVAACNVPVGLAFGGPGWFFVIVVAASHVVIDRVKTVLTRRAATAALVDANARHERPPPPEHLGRAWTPRPAGLFLADQAAHLAVIGVVWAMLPPVARLEPAWTDTVNWVLGTHDRAAVHQVASVAVVFLSLVIVNVRAASLFVGILVRPVEAGVDGEHRWGGRAAPAVDATAAGRGPEPASTPRRWSVRLGPLDALVTAQPEPAVNASPASASAPAAVGGSAKVGATIGILERLLIVVFVLAGTDAAIGFVVAAKTLARLRLLDDRDFAEYYLLGTLGSVSVAIVTGLVGRAALGALLA